MLVLTRKTKEEIRIGNDITVTIVRVKGQSVRIGINAPPHVHILRSEIAGGDGPMSAETTPENPPKSPRVSETASPQTSLSAAIESRSRQKMSNSEPRSNSQSREPGHRPRFESPPRAGAPLARFGPRQNLGQEPECSHRQL